MVGHGLDKQDDCDLLDSCKLDDDEQAVCDSLDSGIVDELVDEQGSCCTLDSWRWHHDSDLDDCDILVKKQ